ncbi:MAG: AI-2E family transporter [Gemmatimonadaceae bacterium]|nr:AI-2E family transporter [Gemmatimonadaceae bacterium]
MTIIDETSRPDPVPPERRGWRTGDFARAAITVLAVWFGLQLLWSVRSLAILVFLASLFGIAVARGVDVLERYRIRRGIASALIVLGTLGAIGGVLALTAPTLIEQGRELQREFPAAVTKVQTWIDSRKGGVIGSLFASIGPAVGQTEAARPTAGAAVTAPAGDSTLSTVASPTLRKWLVTQLVAMVVIGTVSFVVLMLLDVKAAFALGFIAGLLEFIPTVGPVLSAVPAVLMGFVDSPEKALAVAVAYWGIQFLENNLLIPFLMRGEMDLPPAITLIAQTLMTLVFGFLGLMVAVPLTAAVLVPLRMMAERENAREKALRAGDTAHPERP